MGKRSNAVMLGMSYMSLVSLGAYNAALGVAWPSIRQTFSLPLDALGLLLTAGTVGFFVSSVVGGESINRYGAGAHLLASCVVGAVGTLGFALSPVWWGVVAASLIVGFCSGGLEVGTNTFIATRYGAREMNWLHAFYGVGSTAAPLLVTTLLTVGASWRWTYGAVTVLYVLLAIYFALTLRQWQTGPALVENVGGEDVAVSSASTLRLPAVWISVVLFFIYTGIEMTAGQWSYTLLTEGRGIAAASAGRWVSIYWGSFTAGRFLLGYVADRVAPTDLLRASMVGSIIGAVLLWWNAVEWFGFVGLAVLGISFASIYPGLLTVTPQRIGLKHAANAIGFQSGAAGLGMAVLPALAGVLADGLGLEIIGPFIFGAVILITILHEVTVPRGVQKVRAEAPQEQL